MIDLEEYVRDNHSNPFERWFSSLDVQAAAKVSTALLRLEMGNTSNIKWFEGLGEYRIDWGPGYRIYLLREGTRLIILFGGGNKSKARLLVEEYKRRRRAEPQTR